jgi:uncharacterized membrane protein YcaP (DUF421 family)
MGQLRQHGVRNIMEVKEAFIEGDGSITVIKKNS